MEDHKEVVKASMIRLLFFIMTFSLPACAMAKDSTSVNSLGIKDPINFDSIMPFPKEPDLPVLPERPFVPESDYSVGTPEGSISIGGSGAATYSLKIEAPDGGLLTPQIGLCYNSQLGGYGLAGYGFNITGLSAITRGGHDWFHDGRQSGVTYTASDNYFLDGKRLILLSGSPGQDGALNCCTTALRSGLPSMSVTTRRSLKTEK